MGLVGLVGWLLNLYVHWVVCSFACLFARFGLFCLFAWLLGFFVACALVCLFLCVCVLVPSVVCLHACLFVSVPRFVAYVCLRDCFLCV